MQIRSTRRRVRLDLLGACDYAVGVLKLYGESRARKALDTAQRETAARTRCCDKATLAAVPATGRSPQAADRQLVTAGAVSAGYSDFVAARHKGTATSTAHFSYPPTERTMQLPSSTTHHQGLERVIQISALVVRMFRSLGTSLSVTQKAR